MITITGFKLKKIVCYHEGDIVSANFGQ